MLYLLYSAALPCLLLNCLAFASSGSCYEQYCLLLILRSRQYCLRGLCPRSPWGWATLSCSTRGPCSLCRTSWRRLRRFSPKPLGSERASFGSSEPLAELRSGGCCKSRTCGSRSSNHMSSYVHPLSVSFLDTQGMYVRSELVPRSSLTVLAGIASPQHPTP